MTSTARRLVMWFGLAMLLSPIAALAQQSPAVNWAQIEAETLQHFQALVRLDTQSPPGNETRAVEYLEQVLRKEGIPVQRFTLEADRANLVARLKGNGSKKPILLMGHTDVVTVDPSKWKFPPFSAARDGGFIYGRGTLDTRPNVTAGLMMLLMLKRLNVPLDRDVIFLAESGEEGTTRVGIDLMVDRHFDAISAEFCINEGGGATRRDGKVVSAAIGTLEKVPRAVELTARGPAAHGSIARKTNAISHLARALAAVTEWQSPVLLNETTKEQFRRMATIVPAEEAEYLKRALSTDPKDVESAVRYFEDKAPQYASLLRTSVSPTIIQGGNRVNVVPSEAKATLDIRMLPNEDTSELLDSLRRVINDPAIEVAYAKRDGRPRPAGGTSLQTEAFGLIEASMMNTYNTIVIPTMGTGATDSAQLREKGMHCYGVGPAVDAEDAPAGFGAHSDQERILESELYRFIRFYWDAVTGIARTQR